MNEFQHEIQRALQHEALNDLPWPEVLGTATLASWFDVSDLATAAVGAASAALVRYCRTSGATIDTHQLDSRLTNLWFGFTLQPVDFSLPPAWDSIAGDYQAKDGWIRLHTNAPHHKQRALTILGCVENREAVAAQVATWSAQALESAVVDAGGCAAQMHSPEQWQQHEHGRCLNNEPLVHFEQRPAEQITQRRISIERPLQGVRVLDLTRVLAGPVSTRFLAAYGADVLRIDPLDWEEPGVIPEVTLGKRCAGLDLTTTAGQQQLAQLIRHADVLVHGYRPGALADLGFTQQYLHDLQPDLIDISLNAYGWQGPWQNRRGFDSLVQMSSGIAHYGMVHSGSGRPTPLPVQALDHATGYLMAAATIQALELRDVHHQIGRARLSLAATAQRLLNTPRQLLSHAMPELAASDFQPVQETTTWGTAQRVRFPVVIPNVPAHWSQGACALRTSDAHWR